jgi:hypothetical protein
MPSFGESTPSIFLVGVVAREQRIHALLRLTVIPVGSSDLRELSLTGNHGQRTVVNLWLQYGHGTLEEVRSIRISRSTAEELNIVRTIALLSLQTFKERLCLQFASFDRTKLYNGIHSISIFNKPVIPNNRNTSFFSFAEHRTELGTINRTNDNYLSSLLNHCLDLLLLLRYLLVCSLNEGLKTSGSQLIVEHGFSFFPILCAKPRQRNTDRCISSETLFSRDSSAI